MINRHRFLHFRSTLFVCLLLGCLSSLWVLPAAAQDFPAPGDVPLVPIDVQRYTRRRAGERVIIPAVTLTPTVCPFTYTGSMTLDCGLISVPESRDPLSADSTNSLTLTYAIARSPNPLADPVFYLNGGPGSHTLDRIGDAWEPRFDIYLPQRDIIFLEIRGISYSNTSPSGDLNRLAYNSREIAADVHDLVTALDIEQVNLFGISYGTRIAQTVMRDYPAIVRSATLDGVVPLEVDMLADAPLLYDSAFEHLFVRCEQTADCNTTHPDLRTRFFDTTDMLGTSPAVISDVYDPYQNVTVTVQVDNDFLIAHLFRMLYRTDELNHIPGYLEAAINGQYDVFIDDYFAALNRNDTIFNRNAYWMITCNDDGIFSSFSRYVANTSSIRPEVAYRYLPPINFGSYCSNYLETPLATAQALAGITETLAINSPIPTLLTSGEFDPITPPAYGDMVAAGLPNSTHVTFPAFGHSAIGQHSCPDAIFTQFMAAPTQPLNTDCVTTMPAFFDETYTVMMPILFTP